MVYTKVARGEQAYEWHSVLTVVPRDNALLSVTTHCGLTISPAEFPKYVTAAECMTCIHKRDSVKGSKNRRRKVAA